ncbi:hypothetical protein Hanom_Chr00s002928g01707071 [Helianthus anomalus]
MSEAFRHLLTKQIKGLFVFYVEKGLQSADHICKHLQEKRWTKCLQSARRRGFRWRWRRSRGVGGGGGDDGVGVGVSEVEVVSEQWCRRWRWWRSGGGGGAVVSEVEVVAEQRCRRCRWCQEEVNVCEEKTWVHVCSKKRSRRPFLMKGLRENKQTADIKRLRASASRRHKWPEVLLTKKQTEPKR